MNKWSRRGFIGAGIVAGGAFVVGVAIRPGNPVGRLKPLVAPGADQQLVNSWVRIDADNSITAFVPHSEMGQGTHSALAQMLADELDADWATLRVLEAPATNDYVDPDVLRALFAPDLHPPVLLEQTVGNLFAKVSQLAGARITGGSTAVRATGQRGLRIAGAAAREMLVAAAAAEWAVPPGEITTANSMLRHAPSHRAAPYAHFAEAAVRQTMPTAPTLKTPAQYRLMGRPLARKDIPAKVDGTAQFGIDTKIPGQTLKYAAVKGPPVPGATVLSMKIDAAKRMPGVLQILNMGDFVAVVADGYWQAQQALNTIEATYSTTGAERLDQDGLFKRFSKALDEAGETGGSSYYKQGDAKAALGAAAKTLTAEYRVPFLAHAPMEPVNCTAWVRDGKCDIWTGTQVPLIARAAIAKATGIAADAITMHVMYLGGGFGRRLETDYAVIGARIAKATGYPVKTIYSREEDIGNALYRPATMSRWKASLDRAGQPSGFDHVYLFAHHPDGAARLDYYDIPAQTIRTLDKPDMHLRFASWRSVDHSQLGFFNESFIDELAHAAGKDPLAFRLALLGKSPRHAAVLRKAAEMANWGSPLPTGTARGIALVPSFGSIVAEVAEVTMIAGKPRVTRIFCCADPGYAMNPDSFTAQMESAIVFGLSAALYGEISLKNGAVVQSNFHDYKVVRMYDAPEIHVAIINGDSEILGGGGEPGLPPVAPAVANAIFAATGERIRALPIENHVFA